MIDLQEFTILITFFILAPIVGAITLLFLFGFEKRIDLLENKTKKMELEKELQRSRYNQLSNQIQPHFLFNALNMILSLARLGRTEQLVEALEHLSALLKYTYKTTDTLVPLADELSFTRNYIEIQKLRFGSRLRVEVTCDERLHRCLIIPFMLQTLVENSFKHGLETRVGEARLLISFFVREEYVVLHVIDNGQPAEPDNQKGITDGLGLNNIRTRLHLLFDERAGLKIGKSDMGGTMVEVYWPLVMSREKGRVE